MQRLSARLLLVVAVQFATHITFFTLLSWALLSNLLGFDLISVLASGFLMAMATIFLEWLLGPSLVSSPFEPKWIERNDDLVLWSMVHGEAAKAGVKVKKIGVVDMESPNALVYSYFTGRPIILLTKGLLVDLTYPEVRAVVAYMLGCTRSGVLGIVTTLSGLLTLSHRVAGGYIRSHMEKKSSGIADLFLAGWGGLFFALIYPQCVMVSNLMSVYGDEFSILQTGDPVRFVNALLKVAASLAEKPIDPIRTICTPLKCLMFQDPTMALRDAVKLRDVAARYDVDMSRLLGHELKTFLDEGELQLHVFERFWSQPELEKRLEHARSFRSVR